jgi:hypothetical protein
VFQTVDKRAERPNSAARRVEQPYKRRNNLVYTKDGAVIGAKHPHLARTADFVAQQNKIVKPTPFWNGADGISHIAPADAGPGSS